MPLSRGRAIDLARLPGNHRSFTMFRTVAIAVAILLLVSGNAFRSGEGETDDGKKNAQGRLVAAKKYLEQLDIAARFNPAENSFDLEKYRVWSVRLMDAQRDL